MTLFHAICGTRGRLEIMNFIPGDSVGFVGWRGMVGSVLMKRMLEENDFNDISPVFSQPPMWAVKPPPSTARLSLLR